MALIVAPDEGYDSLVSLSDANAYMANMGHSWAGDDSVKEAALRRATQYLQARYRLKDEYIDPVHANVSAACCEAALREISGRLYTDVDAAVVTGETVGPISVSYSDSVRNGGQVRVAIIDDLLRGMTGVGNRLFVTRA